MRQDEPNLWGPLICIIIIFVLLFMIGAIVSDHSIRLDQIEDKLGVL